MGDMPADRARRQATLGRQVALEGPQQELLRRALRPPTLRANHTRGSQELHHAHQTRPRPRSATSPCLLQREELIDPLDASPPPTSR